MKRPSPPWVAAALTAALTTAVAPVFAGAQTSYELKKYVPTLVVSSTAETEAAALALSTNAINFGDVATNTTETRQVLVSNPGTGSFTFTAAPTVTGAAEFAAGLTSCGSSLAAGAECLADVTFSPTSVGTYNGVLKLASVLANSPHEVTLVGTAFNPVSLAGTTLPNATVGLAYSYDFKQLLGVSNEASPPKAQATWESTGTLPAGLSFNTSTGVLSGTPSVGVSSTALSVTATYKGNSAQQAYTVAVAYANSCKEYLGANPGAPSGWYTLDVDGSGPAVPQSYYCDMSSDGGGWTRVVRQFESTPVTTWTGGVNGASYVLSAQAIPGHTQVAFGRDETATYIDYVDWTYTTGDIAAVLVTSPKTLVKYYIHRGEASCYDDHDPRTPLKVPPLCTNGYGTWTGTLTFTNTNSIVGTESFGWAFSARNEVWYRRGYRMQYGAWTTGDGYAWTVWVR